MNLIRFSKMMAIAGFLFGALLIAAVPVRAEDAAAWPAVIVGRESIEETAKPAQTAQIVQLSEMLKWAYDNNPALRAARAELRAVHESLPQAQAGWKPQIDASGNITSNKIDGSNFGGEGTTTKEVQIGINQPLYRGGRTVAATDAAIDRIAAQRALLALAEHDLLLAAATAYMDVLRDRAVLDLRKNNEQVIARNLEATRDRFKAGELTRTDIAQSEARLAAAKADRIRAASTLQASMARFEQVIGKTPGTLATPVVSFPVPGALEDAIAIAERNNPAVTAARFFHKSSEQDVDTIFGELLPELGVFSSWNRQHDPQPGLLKESTTTTFGISATIPLYESGAVRSRVRQAKHTANQRYLEILDSWRGIRRQVVTNWEDLSAAAAEIASRKAQVKASRLARQGVKEENSLGARSILDALDADQEYLDAQVALIGAERDKVVAEFALAATLGMLTPQNLDLTDYSAEYTAHLDEISWKILGIDIDKAAVSP